jgi:adenosylcobinamide amidohydrolase
VITVTLDRPWLIARLPAAMRVLSHAPFGAGYRTTDTVLWREVKNADLPIGFPAEDWFAQQMAPHRHAVGMLTSRDIGFWHQAQALVDGITAHCVVTLGLSNAESVGQRLPRHSADFGTINMLVATDAALTESAQLEALTIAVQARTMGVVSCGMILATGQATGTGTDCTALACTPGQERYAGLHTAAGEAVGAATRQATTEAAALWMKWRDAERAKR